MATNFADPGSERAGLLVPIGTACDILAGAPALLERA
jgi:hypothetical protein